MTRSLRSLPHLKGIRLVAITSYGHAEDYYQRIREAGLTIIWSNQSSSLRWNGV